VPPDFPDEFPHPAMFTSLIELGSMVMDVAGHRMDLTFLDDQGVVRDSLTVLKLNPDQIDSDNDGLPDVWEQFHFGNPTNAQPHIDIDEDGLDNLSEYIAGTNPDDPDSVFAFNSITPSGGNITVSWFSESNRSYTIWRSASLLTNDWTAVASDIPASPPVNWAELVAETNATIYYRVESSMVP